MRLAVAVTAIFASLACSASNSADWEVRADGSTATAGAGSGGIAHEPRGGTSGSRAVGGHGGSSGTDDAGNGGASGKGGTSPAGGASAGNGGTSTAGVGTVAGSTSGVSGDGGATTEGGTAGAAGLGGAGASSGHAGATGGAGGAGAPSGGGSASAGTASGGSGGTLWNEYPHELDDRPYSCTPISPSGTGQTCGGYQMLKCAYYVDEFGNDGYPEPLSRCWRAGSTQIPDATYVCCTY